MPAQRTMRRRVPAQRTTWRPQRRRAALQHALRAWWSVVQLLRLRLGGVCSGRRAAKQMVPMPVLVAVEAGERQRRLPRALAAANAASRPALGMSAKMASVFRPMQRLSSWPPSDQRRRGPLRGPAFRIRASSHKGSRRVVRVCRRGHHWPSPITPHPISSHASARRYFTFGRHLVRLWRRQRRWRAVLLPR